MSLRRADAIRYLRERRCYAAAAARLHMLHTLATHTRCTTIALLLRRCQR